jgi:hypothetical protein
VKPLLVRCNYSVFGRPLHWILGDGTANRPYHPSCRGADPLHHVGPTCYVDLASNIDLQCPWCHDKLLALLEMVIRLDEKEKWHE